MLRGSTIFALKLKSEKFKPENGIEIKNLSCSEQDLGGGCDHA